MSDNLQTWSDEKLHRQIGYIDGEWAFSRDRFFREWLQREKRLIKAELKRRAGIVPGSVPEVNVNQS